MNKIPDPPERPKNPEPPTGRILHEGIGPTEEEWKKFKKVAPKILGAILCFAALAILIGTFVFQFQHPTWTETQIVIKFWKHYILVVILAISGELLIRK